MNEHPTESIPVLPVDGSLVSPGTYRLGDGAVYIPREMRITLDANGPSPTPVVAMGPYSDMGTCPVEPPPDPLANSPYELLLRDILERGKRRPNRTGVDTLGIFGAQIRFDLRAGFPLVTTKRVPFWTILEELRWFLRGETNVKSLQTAGVTIWDEWATPEQCAKFGREPGDLGPVYGHQWRNFGATWPLSFTGNGKRVQYERDGFDQIAWLVNELRTNPASRRLILTGWNPREASQVALPPCHTLSQFYVQDGELSCQLYQRSADMFLGVPFNIASYALLTHVLATMAGLRVGEFVHTFGDAHIYVNHLDVVREQLARTPYPLPTLVVDPRVATLRDPAEVAREDFTLINYRHHPKLSAAVAV